MAREVARHHACRERRSSCNADLHHVGKMHDAFGLSSQNRHVWPTEHEISDLRAQLEALAKLLAEEKRAATFEGGIISLANACVLRRVGARSTY